MGVFWRLAWLYTRIVLLVLVVAFGVTLLLINLTDEESIRLLPWTARTMNVYGLLVAFVLGVLLLPLGRTIGKTWKDYQQEKQRQHDQQAEEALKRYRQEQRQAEENRKDEAPKQG